jgi:hypothetical protein
LLALGRGRINEVLKLPAEVVRCLTQYWVRALPLPEPLFIPTRDFPVGGFLLSGVEMLMLVGVFSHCCRYLLAAVVPEAPLAPAEFVEPPPPGFEVLVEVLPPLLQAARKTAAATVATEKLIFRISKSFSDRILPR